MTSGLYGFIEDGEYFATRNNSDSYPSGLGLEFFTSCKNGDYSGYPIFENDIWFIHNSLFCEWAYFYDKDKKIFEIWKGYQTNPDLSNPFGKIQKEGYYPCKRLFKGNIDLLAPEVFTKDIINKLISIQREEKLNKLIK